jgi:hypothetical protein
MKPEAKAKFLALSKLEKVYFLALLMHALTVTVRDIGYTYGTSSEIAQQKVMNINEIMHTASGKVAGSASRSKFEYPDEIFLDMLIESAQPHCVAELEEALDFAVERVRSSGIRK